ncbi:MAG: hypothetical protein KDD73_12390 [Anaerolineales bacterium]|nr:hypothetical protein [Anaerolineales bacterium]
MTAQKTSGLHPAFWAAVVLLLTVPALWPFLSHGGWWDSHDGVFHLYRLLSLREAWAQGNLYPRSFPDFAFGYGYPVQNFYGPLTYYVALAINALLPPIAAMRATFALSYPLAALAIWWAARDLWRQDDGTPNERAGLLSAVAYSYLPYHMADVQLRGALAESWAFVWWPLILWAIWRARLWPLALSSAALILSHNLSALLILPVALVVALVALWQQRKRAGRLVGSWLGAALLALMLSAFYWLPVLLESGYVMLSRDVGGRGVLGQLHPWRAWVATIDPYRYWAITDPADVAIHPLSWPQLALMAAALAALPALWLRGRRMLLIALWLLLALTLFLLTSEATALWERILIPFGMIQFPWRWLGPAALLTALLVGGVAAARWRGWGRWLPNLAVAGLLIWLAWSSMVALPWQPRAVDVARHPVPMWEEDQANQQVGATWTQEFLPVTVEEQRWLLTRPPETPNEAERSPLQVQRAGSDGATLWADVEAAESAWFSFPRFAYPSMRMTVDGNAVPVEARSVMGLASAWLEPGSHRVVLSTMPLSDQPWLTALPALALLWGLRRHTRWLAVGSVALGVVGAWLWLRPTPLPPAATHGAEAAIPIGEQATLLGLRELPATISAGETAKVTLLWANRAATNEDYVTFIHLRDGDGNVVAQDDRVPNSGTVPTARWLPGMLVEDLHLLDIPADLPAGDYELWAGLYRVVDGDAQPLAGDDGAHFVGRVGVR